MSASAFYRATVTINRYAAETSEVSAYMCRACPAIAVTRSSDRHPWVLTHVPTGRSMSRTFHRLGDAKRTAAAVAAALSAAGADVSTTDPDEAARRIIAVPDAYAALFPRTAGL